jgi:lysozyme
MLKGFDASAVQGVVPWQACADADMRFTILRGQIGNDGFDPSFKANVLGAKGAGIIPFAYCFAYPLPSPRDDEGKELHPGRDPRDQARLFVDRVCAAHPSMHGRPLFLDFEWPEPQDWAKWGCTAEQISAWCAACAEEVETYSGRTPILYTYPDWWAHVSKADVSWATLYPLWIASYGPRAWPDLGSSPPIPAPWADWLFWQWDGNGGMRLPNGVDADFVVFNGDEDALRRLAA